MELGAPTDLMGLVDFMKPVELGALVKLARTLEWGEPDGSVRGRWLFGSR